MSSGKSIKRIYKDVSSLILEPLVDEKIFIIPDKENIKLVRACIIGPEDTPYENGIYFFEIRFPDNYPWSPPKVVFKTTDGKSRMHPNYYSCGKVCVSIIGTWTGPGWTSCQSLSSVLITFRSLFIKNPLWQEPGFNHDKSINNENYNKLITYENFRIGIIKMFNNTPPGFEVFKDIMNRHLKNNKNKILSKCNKLLNEKNELVSAPQIYNFYQTINYESINQQINDIYNKLENDEKLEKSLEILTSKIGSKIKYEDLNEIYNSSEEDYNIDNLLLHLQMEKKIKRHPNGTISSIQ